MFIRKWLVQTIFILVSLFVADAKAKRSVIHSTVVATAGILATQMGMYAYYAKKGSLICFQK